MTILEELKWRGLVADCTDLAALSQRLDAGPTTLYCGFDPSGDSLHVGSLVGQLMLRRFQLRGHRPIALAGGATGMIGDPSGKSAERNLLSREQLDRNLGSIKAQLSGILDFQSKSNPARMVDNASWTAGVGYLEFLRDIGKHFSVNMMMAKDSVRSRMEGEGGISYTEFSYMLLQAHDFYHLRKEHGCELQIGGSDQWGNITAGTELLRKKLAVPSWGLTFPLITKADGSKFGKTEDGAIWLDPGKTSPYRFYQFFVNTEDSMVPAYLRKFTLLDPAEVEALDAKHQANPAARARPIGHSPARSRRSSMGRARATTPSARARSCSAAAWMGSPRPSSAKSRARSPPRPSRNPRSRAPGPQSPTFWSTADSAPPRGRRERISRAAAST